jgi:putative phosphoribosyl transferase
MRFRDREDAGRHLAGLVRRTDLGPAPVVVLALPRGGVPVAFEVAQALGAPLDVLVVRKLGVPFQPELAMGAIGEGGVRVENSQVIRSIGLGAADVAAVEERERSELERRAHQYRDGHPRLSLEGSCAVIVDDGIATGSTVRAACQVARRQGAERVVVAVPVASRLAVDELKEVCDELLTVAVPEPFFAVGEWYRDFSQTTDDKVVDLLRNAAGRGAGPGSSPEERRQWSEEVDVPAAGGVTLTGHLTVPTVVAGTVVFAHGSGSSRHSPRNRYVADVLNRAGLVTLLVDLLSMDEELDRGRVFDIPLLGRRLADAAAWVMARSALSATGLGYFGASTGAAAALWAAALPGGTVGAVVSRGGRPDLAGPALAAVRAATLLIVGGRDEQVLEPNRTALAELRCESRLTVVPGATHLFEEPGALETVAALARDWFTTHLRPPADPIRPDRRESGDAS